MWMKTAVHELQKWVPTSAEYRREQLRAAAEASRVADERKIPPVPTEFADPETPIDGEIIDGEDWPDTPQPGGAA